METKCVQCDCPLAANHLIPPGYYVLCYVCLDMWWTVAASRWFTAMQAEFLYEIEYKKALIRGD